jgi:trigger factor
MQHRVLEMRRAGMSDTEIRAREAQLWQNILASTRQALIEHFLLDKIATQEKIEVDPMDIESEIRTLAIQSGQTPRRVRARLEKEGALDDLHTQVLERKALERILEYAEYEDVETGAEEVAAEEAVAEHATGQEPEPSQEPAAETADQPSA